jgi:hypothetical protein
MGPVVLDAIEDRSQNDPARSETFRYLIYYATLIKSLPKSDYLFNNQIHAPTF